MSIGEGGFAVVRDAETDKRKSMRSMLNLKRSWKSLRILLPLLALLPLLTACPQERELRVEVEYWVDCEGCKVSYTEEDGEQTQALTTANWSRLVLLEVGMNWTFEGEVPTGTDGINDPYSYRVTITGASNEIHGESTVGNNRNFFSVSGVAE